MGLFRPFYPQIGEFGWAGPDSTSVDDSWCEIAVFDCDGICFRGTELDVGGCCCGAYPSK